MASDRLASARTPDREALFDSKAEQAYDARLRMLQAAGEIEAYWLKPCRLRLSQVEGGSGAKNNYYAPDFMVHASDGVLEMHEVKGHWREAARVRFRQAADVFPCFRFVAIKGQARRSSFHETDREVLNA